MTKNLTKWLAFTLAEVLITLAIIGVVAGLTIPSLLANTNEKGLNTSNSVFQRRLGEALKIMNLQGTLAGQPSTQAFVDELGRHMKITKTCPSTELSNCFVSEFTSGTETIEVKDLQASKNLNKDDDYGTETIGVVFGNGTRALIAYKPNCKQDQFNNSNEDGSPVRLTTSGSGKQTLVSLDSDALSILYILQDRKNNNVYDNSAMLDNKGNIRGINISFGINKCADGATAYGGKCYLLGSGTKSWTNAKSYCAENSMSLIPNAGGATDGELAKLMKDLAFKTALNISTGDFWSASEREDLAREAYLVNSDGSVTSDTKVNYYKVLCVGN